MTLTFVEPDPANPLRVCGRCGIEKKDQRKYRYDCQAWGTTYDHHVWVWWPDKDEAPPKEERK